MSLLNFFFKACLHTISWDWEGNKHFYLLFLSFDKLGNWESSVKNAYKNPMILTVVDEDNSLFLIFKTNTLTANFLYPEFRFPKSLRVTLMDLVYLKMPFLFFLLCILFYIILFSHMWVTKIAWIWVTIPPYPPLAYQRN